MFKPGTTNDDLRKFSRITVHGGDIPQKDTPEVDYTRTPRFLSLVPYQDDHNPPIIPEPGETLDKILYDDLIRLVFESAGTGLWAHAKFDTYYALIRAQQYLLKHFRHYRNRPIVTRTRDDYHLFVRFATEEDGDD